MPKPSPDDPLLRSASRCRRALTAIEFLITVAVIGILAAILVPYWGTSTVDDLKGAAEVVISDLAYARNLSVSNNSNYEFAFDTKANTYTLRHTGSNPDLDTLPPTPYGAYTVPSETQVHHLSDLSHGGARVHLVGVVARGDGYISPVNDLTFEALGNTSRSDESIIWLRAGEGDNRRYIAVHVAAMTGLTSISKVYGELPADSYIAPPTAEVTL